MAIIATKIIKVEIPKSYADSRYEDYEWYLEWYNKFGTPCYYMFYDWTCEELVETTHINVKSDEIKTLINSQERNISVVAEDVRKCDVPAFKSLTTAKNVARLFKDGTRERLAINSSAITCVNSKQRYNIELTLQRRQEPLII
jgi:hypothetical protein